MKKGLFLAVLLALFSLTINSSYYLEEDDTFIPEGEGDWYFTLNLEPECVQKYKKAVYYPEENTLTLFYKDKSQDFIKEQDILAQNTKPEGPDITVYGYYQEKDPLTGNLEDTKYWVYKKAKSE